MSAYTLHLGDCLEFMRTMDAGSVDAVITSPPYDDLRSYNGNSDFDFIEIAQQLYRITKYGGVVVWIVSDSTKNGSESCTSFRQALYFKDVCGFNLHDTMIYEQSGTGAKGSNRSYWQAFEYMFVLSKGTPKTVNRISDVKNKSIGMIRSGRYRENGKQEKPHATLEYGVRSNIWRYAVGFMDDSDKVDHPAPFPESLARDHILSWSNYGDTILDPFTGSGTTGKMSIKLGRNFIGCEIDPTYFAIAERRIRDAAAQPALFTMDAPQVKPVQAAFA